jgi:hypothetical protein
MERKTKEINLFGKKLLLGERTAIDVLNLSEALKNYDIEKKSEPSFYLLTSATVIEDALKININNLKWYNFLKKRKYRVQLSAQYLLKNLTQQELMKYTQDVYELEGLIKDSSGGVGDAEKKSQQ